MENRLLSQLRKAELLRLPLIIPGTVRDMKEQLRTRLIQFSISFRGVRINDYIRATMPRTPRTNKTPKRYDETDEYKRRAQKKSDDELFNKILPTLKPKKNDTDIIKQNIIEERHLFDNMGTLYNTQQTELRKEYENRVKDVQNKKNFLKYMKHNMQLIKQRAKLEVVIADDEDKRIAFTESLLKCYNQMKRNDKIVVKAYTLDDKYKWFSLSSNHNIMTTLGHIAVTIDLI